ncbi:MAG: ABC transporter ATP-binding protein [Candidatus Dormibacteraeota bacterium]|uniref:ABC transporter ATP-binding protein n=1 Tax=Candidatus Amunia macphersoniae TaxID=3127014 RepID=A0A934KMZ4_9BACT|nr:ABC transporter ATP-binding protein [Candidatus Dormibacteraeota bacterium]
MSAVASPQAVGLLTTPPAATAAVRADGVVRRYRNGRGVGPVDLAVGPGETMALMGRNGCGKTTLLRLLATVSRPQRGEVSWFDGPAAPARAHIGLALDGALEDGGLTGRQATYFWCAQWISARDEVRTRTDGLLDRLGLAAAADAAVGSYSFGMRRRLALVAALVHDPLLALLDEPTAGLDPAGCAELAVILAERRERARSTIVASNDPGFVEAVAGQVTFLDEGLVVRCATPQELLDSLPRGRVAELVTHGRCDAAGLRRVAGVVDVAVAGSSAMVRFDGDSTIAALVAAADAPGGRLRELRLRRPDLGDCFRELTGQMLEDGHWSATTPA